MAQSSSDNSCTGGKSRSVKVAGQLRATKAGVPQLPDPLAGASKVEDAPLSSVPTVDSLAQFLKARGVDTSTWGQGDTKDVSKYWKEIEGDEAGLEMWRLANGKLQPVRVVHVLRAKVCSPESYSRGIFCFNTWQQYGDGRIRTRNGLLSEKLCMSEMPLEDHLHEVCARAVTEEEMQRVAESALKIGPGSPAPTFDSNYRCPLHVLSEKFVDHTIELETSKSYPGLLTMYHLYTVDIICSGLPAVDFNTLEFAHEDKSGNRPLKYIHAWVWLEWPQIQRYLLEGSTLKERKTKGSFEDALELLDWLSQFDMDLEAWGTGPFSSVDNLFDELQNEETHLEHWGRQDGVPLLMRVVHALQLKVGSTDPRQAKKFLFNTWRQSAKGDFKTVNRLMSKKLSTKNLPFDEERFSMFAKQAVADELSYIVDAHFEINPKCPPAMGQLTPSGVTMSWAAFEDHRVTVEESVSYKGFHTMYHLYSMEVECDNIPVADFVSLEFRASKKSPTEKELKSAYGWRWFNWEQTLDILQKRAKSLDHRESQASLWRSQQATLTDAIAQASGLSEIMSKLSSQLPAGDPTLKAAMQAQDHLCRELDGMSIRAKTSDKRCQKSTSENLAKFLPPSMLSKMSEQLIVAKDFFEEAEQKRLLEERATRALQGRRSTSSISSSATSGPLIAWGSSAQRLSQ